MKLEHIEITVGDTLRQSDFKEVFGQGATGKGIEIRYDDKGQKYLWLFAREGGRYDDSLESDKISYIGEDPQGPNVESNEDQRLTRGNKELREAIDTPIPIFLFFKGENDSMWEYQGEVEVISFSYLPQNGRYIYQFVLEKIPQSNENSTNQNETRPVSDDAAPDINPPPRSDYTVSRVIRDTQVVEQLKREYDHRCQVCGVRLQSAEDMGYSEGHHIRPLGRPHNGTDERSNILILCSNHHADFDNQQIRIDEGTYEIEHPYDESVNGDILKIAEGHSPDKRSLRYHNQLSEF